LNPIFNFTHAGQILVELLLIVAPKLPLHALRVVHDEIQNRSLLREALIELRWRSPGLPEPNSRSKTSRGLDSGATGVVSERHDKLNW